MERTTMVRTIPSTISTGCPELDRVWSKYSSVILNGPQVLIPDTDADLNWHAFLGHSIDTQGFRAGEFAGVDFLPTAAPAFIPLKQRGLGVPELGALWEIAPIRVHLLTKTKRAPLQATLDVLKQAGGDAGRSLAGAFETFPYRKGHWAVRALLQNSALLKEHDYSFRRWLQGTCHRLGVAFPPRH